MSHIKAIITYLRPKAFVSKSVNASDAVVSSYQNVYPVVSYIHPVFAFSESPTAPVFNSIWDDGDSIWDVDGFGNPQSKWDLEL